MVVFHTASPSTDETSAQSPPSAVDILERMTDALVMFDHEWRAVYANRAACRINQKSREHFIGKTLWEVWPAFVSAEAENQCRRAMDEQVEAHFEHYDVTQHDNRWLEMDAFPTQEGLNLLYRDITDRKR
ncbi:MAG: sensor hybrid histidine kinase, partial [Capsulimonas sp.]|nr:sensor hybrid histidine kinase [Capsulimonas sp.]